MNFFTTNIDVDLDMTLADPRLTYNVYKSNI